jgi:small-conductance mechanosensitive channel
MDQNGDSRADLAWYNTATGVTSLWVMNGAAMASSATAMTQPSWRLVDVQ